MEHVTVEESNAYGSERTFAIWLSDEFAMEDIEVESLVAALRGWPLVSRVFREDRELIVVMGGELTVEGLHDFIRRNRAAQLS